MAFWPSHLNTHRSINSSLKNIDGVNSADAIPERLFRFIDVERLQAPSLLLYGDGETEDFHMSKFKRDLKEATTRKPVELVSLGGCGHNLAQYLKKQDELVPLLQSMTCNDVGLSSAISRLPEPYSCISSHQG